MYITAEDYERLKEHRTAIERVARTGSQSNTGPWYVMDEIKRLRTGSGSNGHCAACVIELYRDFWNMILEYEQVNNIQNG